MSATADPVELIRRIRDEQAELNHRVDRRGLDDGKGLEPAMTGSLPTAARIARATAPEPVHRRAYRRKKPIPVKPSRLDPFIEDIRVWLTLDPGLTALAIEERLTVQHGHLVSLGTIQRLVKRIRTDLMQAEMGAASASASQAA